MIKALEMMTSVLLSVVLIALCGLRSTFLVSLSCQTPTVIQRENVCAFLNKSAPSKLTQA